MPKLWKYTTRQLSLKKHFNIIIKLLKKNLILKKFIKSSVLSSTELDAESDAASASVFSSKTGSEVTTETKCFPYARPNSRQREP